MKAYGIWNENEDKPATPLHFLSRADAARYVEQVKWPWMTDGHFVTSAGKRLPLEVLRLSVRPVVLNAVYSPELHGLFWLQKGVLGSSAVIPGYCFVPEDWKQVEEEDLKDPAAAALIRELEEKLRFDEANRHFLSEG